METFHLLHLAHCSKGSISAAAAAMTVWSAAVRDPLRDCVDWPLVSVGNRSLTVMIPRQVWSQRMIWRRWNSLVARLHC
jgi:hypothetical protein